MNHGVMTKTSDVGARQLLGRRRWVAKLRRCAVRLWEEFGLGSGLVMPDFGGRSCKKNIWGPCSKTFAAQDEVSTA